MSLNSDDKSLIWKRPVYLLTGGIVGGLMMVPILACIFMLLSFPDDRILHMVLGTTSAIIVLTSITSLHAHHTYSAVNWWIICASYFPGSHCWPLAGSTLAGQLSNWVLSIIFVLFIYAETIQMWLNIRPAEDYSLSGRSRYVYCRQRDQRNLQPGSHRWRNADWYRLLPAKSDCTMHAIGTSAAIGFPVALASAAGYGINGLIQA